MLIIAVNVFIISVVGVIRALVVVAAVLTDFIEVGSAVVVVVVVVVVVDAVVASGSTGSSCWMLTFVLSALNQDLDEEQNKF